MKLLLVEEIFNLQFSIFNRAKPGLNLQSGEARNCFAVKLLTLGILKKNIFVCFNGLYTPFGSPVIGGQKRLIATLCFA